MLTLFRPPQATSDNFFVSSEDEKTLVSLETYRYKFQQGRLHNMRVNKLFIAEDTTEKASNYEKTPNPALSTNLPIHNTPGGSTDDDDDYNDVNDQAQISDETNDSKINVTFISFSEFSEDLDDETETDYAESMSESTTSSLVLDGLKTFRASFILDMPVNHHQVC